MKATHTLQLKKLLISTVLLSALAGCGQSGPLYLPEQQTEQNQPQDTAKPAIAEEQVNTQVKQEQ
ncbi:lipoprotein [Pseudoalteromonas sp. SG45-5]|uniref:LPS translocon maturation chaperone LptM n=1 Tax=unclassified Pseudoalteromonas TaxID=194690 RepID=UPI0015FD1353|nr:MULTISPECIES: lipoprotein [unclassified Pseudoalteromonas]MBB1386092.1 lipoprotein [Pseudoalteromonas sp. SG45-5]MBB1394002.1 lipoprotein [Pseudoalteromonas sp. SG44-4]MBB1446362.1 lipoprotein [Pseudoalteromonas sp. SG41-6]